MSFPRATLFAFTIGFTLLGTTPAAAHQIPGVTRMNPGDGFTIASFRGLALDPQTKRYQRSAVMLQNLRDSAWVFLSFDPNNSRDLAEAKRFENALKTLPNTRGWLVIPPAQSMMINRAAEAMSKTGLSTPVIIDDRDIFPYAFRHELTATPRYEVLDHSQTLVIQNAVSLSEKTPTGETLANLIKLIDKGQVISPWVVSTVDQVIDDPRE